MVSIRCVSLSVKTATAIVVLAAAGALSAAALRAEQAPAASSPSGSAALAALESAFRDPPEEARIMMRWWWFGPAVTKAGLEREMPLMKRTVGRGAAMKGLPGLGFALAFNSGVVAFQPPQPASRASRIVYVTVADKNGTPVSDLTASELVIKEGGKIVVIDRAEVSNEPLQIALIVDDSGTGIFRSPLARFVQRMEGRATMSLSSVVGQTMKLVDYTPDMSAIMKGLASLNARPGTPDGGQLLEGISEAALELERLEARRPVIVALTVGGEEHSNVSSDLVLDELRKSGATLHVFSVERSAIRSTVVPQGPGDLLQENMQLARVLGDGPKQSGGRHQSIVASAGFLVGLDALASELTSQYRVSYTLPPGAKPSERLDISVKRKGVVVRAPVKLPTR